MIIAHALTTLLALSLLAQSPGLSIGLSAAHAFGQQSGQAAVTSDADARFGALQSEFDAAWSAWKAEIKADPAGDPPTGAKAGASPPAAFYPRFEAMARADHPGALRWCIRFAAASGLFPRTLADEKSKLYARLIDLYVGEPWIKDVLIELRTDALGTELGLERGIALLERIRQQSVDENVKSDARFNQALVYAGSKHEGSRERALEILRSQIAEHPESQVAERARGAQFKLERLQIGMIAPDFTTADVDGVEFSLSDYRGKVVVLDFWGFW